LQVARNDFAVVNANGFVGSPRSNAIIVLRETTHIIQTYGDEGGSNWLVRYYSERTSASGNGL